MKPVSKFIKWWWGIGSYGDITVATFLFLILGKLDKVVLFPLYLALWLSIRKFNLDRQRAVENALRGER